MHKLAYMMPEWVNSGSLGGVGLPNVNRLVERVSEFVALFLQWLVFALGSDGVLQVRVYQVPGECTFDYACCVRLYLVGV